MAQRPAKWVIVAGNIHSNVLRSTGLKSTQISDPYTSARRESEIPAALSAIDSTFANYARYLTGCRALNGKSVLEIGPGNNIGVALRFAAAGARSVAVVDRFVPLQVSGFHRLLYQALRGTLSEPERRRFDAAVDLSKGVVPASGVLRYINRGIEDAGALPPSSVDVVVSNAVLEEVHAIDRTFAALDRVLRPGGLQIHKIDLSDYGMFSKHGYHPLEFLTIPAPVYRWMSEDVGLPNRRLVDYYRRKMQELGYAATIYTTWVLGNGRELVPPRDVIHKDTDFTDTTVPMVRAIRPRLPAALRALPDEELAVQGILLVAEKR